MLKKFFRKKSPEPSVQPTLKERTASWWQWFSENADELYQAIEDQRFSDYTESFSKKVHEFFPGLAWVFGPGPDEDGHSLTLSPEGNSYLAIAVAYIISKAPTLEGWTFYSSRQPSEDFASSSIEVAGQKVTAKEIWVSPTIDNEAEEIDVVCWTPVFKDLPKEDRLQITFLWLDEALGELTVSQRLGSIDIHGDSLASAMPLTELPEYIAKVETKHQWKPVILGEAYASYKLRERADFERSFLRSDIIGGTSLLHILSVDHIKEDGKLDHPLPEWGIDYLFVSIPREFFTAGKQIDERADLEDAIQDRFDASESGRVLGGAFGSNNLYIDLIVIDGQNGVSAILSALENHPLGKESFLYYFDKARFSKPLR